MDIKKYLLLFLMVIISQTGWSQLDIEAAKALLKRVLPEHSGNFIIKYIPPQNNQDVFEIKDYDGKIILAGNNGVSIGSALNYYLKNYCNSHISWNGNNIQIPGELPSVKGIVRKESPYKFRYYLNYVTFNYTMVWWDWERWEREIDWMALNGINMPLAITGRNAVWQKVYKDMGFSDDELKEFFSGPAYSGFNAMGLLNGYGGPLPQSWIDSQKKLQQEILKRQRSLGMTPILPAFTGHVPPGFREKFPEANINKIHWTVFPEVDLLNPTDSLFVKIGNKFIAEQKKIYGTDHLYSADPFIEVRPPSRDSLYLNNISKKIYESMSKADPEAKWIMQGWMFYFMEDFWDDNQIQALLSGVADDDMIVLDLWSETRPNWQRTHAYYGKPWIWCMLHNFGGRTNLFGKMSTIAKEPYNSRTDKHSGKLSGIGLTMEAIGHTPIIYELMTANTWRDNPIDLEVWVDDYIERRYGKDNINTNKAWDILRETVYDYTGNLNAGGSKSIIVNRPGLKFLGERSDVHSFYDPMELLAAWRHMIQASEYIETEGIKYDLLDITRQVLANYADALHVQYVSAVVHNNLVESRKFSSLFLQVIEDMDELLATHKDFLLGQWLEKAKSHATNKVERDLYEFNARNLITMWHGKKGDILPDYAYRHWSGLLADFYKVRWNKFFDRVEESMKENEKPDTKKIANEIRNWEWEWVNSNKEYPTRPTGDPVNVSQRLFENYFSKIKKLGNPNRIDIQETLKETGF